MNENIRIMLEKLSQDEEAQKKLGAIRDPEEAYQLVTSIHGGYTKEEFIAVVTAIQKQMNQDLTAEDLSKAAGGEGTDASEVITNVLVSTATAASMAASMVGTIYATAMLINLAASV